MTTRIVIIVGIAIAAVVFMFIIGKAADKPEAEENPVEKK